MGTIIVTVIILGGVIAAFLWTRSGNRKVGGSCSKHTGGCENCHDASCPASRAVASGEKNKYDELASFRPKYDAVFFDLDGTLLNTAGDLTDALNYVMESRGYKKLTEEDVIPVLGNGVINLLHTFLPEDISEADFRKCYDDFAAFYSENASKKTYAYEGMRPLLENLKAAGFKTAVITNKNDDIAKTLIADFFPGLVDFTIGRTEFMNRKPDPAMMRFAASQTETELTRIMYVGDSEVDMEFAAAAGTGCILVSWGFRGRQGLPDSVPVVDEPRAILAAVS